MAKPFARGKMLWFSYKHPHSKKWINETTGCGVDKEDDAKRYIASFLEALAAGSAPAGPRTVEQFATGWFAKRSNATAPDERARFAKHVAPRIGSMPIHEVKPKHLDDLIMTLRAEGKLAPRTIRSISGLLHTMFKRAVKEELLVTNPVQMERGTLPKKVDKDPTWRSEAIFTRDEAEQLISDPRILLDRRVLYALKFLGGGMRHGEAARLTWRNYDAQATPLGRIALGVTKSGVPREVPVHPTLARILDHWKQTGWAETYGEQPRPSDLIVPTRNMTVRQPTEAQEALIADLALLGLRVRAGQSRNRRGHDLRRTFISLARTDGAIDSHLRWVTHGPTSDMMDVYSTFTWSALCAEVAKLKIELRESRAGDIAPELLTGSLQRADLAGKRWKNPRLSERKRATPTGFEPVYPA